MVMLMTQQAGYLARRDIQKLYWLLCQYILMEFVKRYTYLALLELVKDLTWCTAVDAIDIGWYQSQHQWWHSQPNDSQATVIVSCFCLQPESQSC